MTILEQLQEKQKESGITQEEIGRRLGITKQNVNIKLHNKNQRFSSTLATAETIGLRCRILKADGEEIEGSQGVIEAARRSGVSTEPFREIVEALGWTIDFDWPEGTAGENKTKEAIKA